MLRRLSLVLLILASGLSGCLEHFWGGCPPQSRAEWREPDLYAALEAMKGAGRDVRFHPAPPGLSWESPANRSGWTNFSLQSVRWNPTGNPVLQLTDHVVGLAGWFLESDYTLTTTRPLNHSVDELRSEFDAVIANLTGAPPERPSHLWDAFVASKKEVVTQLDRDQSEASGYSYKVRLEPPLQLGELVGRGLTSGNVTDPTPTDRWVSWANWSFGFNAPSATLYSKTPDGPFEPTVGANDRVRLEIPSRHTRDETGSKTWIAESLANLEQPTPTFAEWKFQTRVC